jgi:hypothetical protein
MIVSFVDSPILVCIDTLSFLGYDERKGREEENGKISILYLLVPFQNLSNTYFVVVLE